MKTILTIAPILFLLFSCDDKVYFNIPNNEKPLLKNNDKVCFIDNNHNIDSFVVMLTDEYEVSDKRYYHERITVSYQKLKGSSYFERFFIQQGTEVTNISFCGYYYPTIYKNENTVNLNINGVNYPSVYVKYYNSFPDSIPKKVYYSHTQGLIRYDFSDTLYYVLKNK